MKDSLHKAIHICLHIDHNKTQLSVSTPWRYIRGLEIQLHSFLPSALDDQSASCPDPLFLGKRPCPHLMRSLGAREPVWAFWRAERFAAVACYRTRTPDLPVHSPATKPNAPFRVHVAYKPPTTFVAYLICGTFADLRNLEVKSVTFCTVMQHTVSKVATYCASLEILVIHAYKMTVLCFVTAHALAQH